MEDYLTLIDEMYLKEKIINDIKLGVLDEAAIFDKKSFKNPIYIVSMNGKSPLSGLICKATGDQFSHACIAFNSSLNPMYSFGSKGKSEKGTMGFTKAAPQDTRAFPNEGAFYSVYVMYVTDVALSMMKERLAWFQQNASKLKYDFVGLAQIFVGMSTEYKNKKWFCSRFVMEIIKAGVETDKKASLYRPQQIANLDNITCVNKGDDIHNYDKSITDKNEKLVRQGKFDDIKFTK